MTRQLLRNLTFAHPTLTFPLVENPYNTLPLLVTGLRRSAKRSAWVVWFDEFHANSTRNQPFSHLALSIGWITFCLIYSAAAAAIPINL